VGAAWRRIGLSPLRLDREPESAAGKRVQIAVKAKKAIQRNGKKDNLSSGGRQGGVFGTTLPASNRQTDLVHNTIFSHFYNAEKANEITRQYFPRELLLSSPGSGGETAVVWFTGLDEDYVFGSCLVGWRFRPSRTAIRRQGEQDSGVKPNSNRSEATLVF
jgi:hypothetical protein